VRADGRKRRKKKEVGGPDIEIYTHTQHNQTVGTYQHYTLLLLLFFIVYKSFSLFFVSLKQTSSSLSIQTDVSIDLDARTQQV
jgi:hypothetical protein